jgi:hypothetical protein
LRGSGDLSSLLSKFGQLQRREQPAR